MMDYPLTLAPLLRRSATLFGGAPIVSKLSNGTIHRSTYADVSRRAAQLAAALRELGIRTGDRVGTLCWNHHQHLEAYFGVPLAGAVLHTLNVRLHETDLRYIVGNAGDRAIIVDEELLPLYARLGPAVSVEHVIVVGSPARGQLGFEDIVEAADPAALAERLVDERSAAAMCYTSGTTGRPKGVVYSQRSLVLHALVQLTTAIGPRESDVVLPVVPLFHANGWGYPISCAVVGAAQVLPGRHLDPASVLDLLESERVTLTAGVPTVWLGVLRLLDEQPTRYDLSHLRAIVIGGSAVPLELIRGFDRHGLRVIQAWGMTEMSPIGTVADLAPELEHHDQETKLRIRARQGRPVPFVEIRARSQDGSLTPWSGSAIGELEVRGPAVARAYYASPESDDRFTDDGWFRTGDIVTIDPLGYIDIQDRAKDLIKSGGEWISSVALENALMGHSAVAEAAVIGVPDAKWQERPLGVIVLKPGRHVTAEELHLHLERSFAKWWLPDTYQFVDEIPKTAAGKFRKTELRDRFARGSGKGSTGREPGNEHA